MKIDKYFKQGINILIITSIISSGGGLSLEGVKESLSLIAPLIIILPALNDMTGDFGTIISSKYTTITYLGYKNKNKKKKLRKLFKTIMIIALLMSFYVAFIAVLINYLRTGMFEKLTTTITISVITTMTIMVLLTFLTTKVGDYLFKKGLDPDNYLIPITTSMADLGSMSVMALLLMILV